MESAIQLELKLPAHVIEAARSTNLLDTGPEEAFDRLTRLAARLLRAPTSLVTVLDDQRQFFKSTTGLAEPWASRRQTPLTHSFCQHVVSSGKPLIVTDANKSELLKNNLAIPEIGVISYIGVPLQVNKVSFGALCVIDGEAREWSSEDLDTLNDLSASVLTEVELRMQWAELEQAHSTLVEQHDQLGKLVERQNELIGIAAHDMRSPLTVAYGYAKLMSGERLGLAPAHRKMATAVCDSCQFMVRLIDDILDFEALKSGKLALQLQELDPQPLFTRVTELSRMLAEAKEITVELIPPEQPLLPLRADSHKLEQIMNNLIGNAIKYSPPKSRVTVSARTSASHLEFTVQDEGPGIAPERIPKIFNPFQRGESHGQKGVGLGLAIVERIILGHHGTINLESELGKGTRFTVRLPLDAGRGH